MGAASSPYTGAEVLVVAWLCLDAKALGYQSDQLKAAKGERLVKECDICLEIPATYIRNKYHSSRHK